MSGGEACASARANIALSKYWGKRDLALNLPAVPSISLTVDGLVTQTHVSFDPRVAEDSVMLDGAVAEGRAAARVIEMLERVRKLAGIDTPARVESTNTFPTAAGLASSASGFAALAGAAAAAAGLKLDNAALSRLARRSSASAARSIYGGFVELPAGEPGQDDLAARPIFDAEHWDLSMIIAITATGPKKVGSTEGMERSRETSPFYFPWVEEAPRLNERVRRAIDRRDLEALGRAMELSTTAFHACAMTSSPPIFYWRPETLAALAQVRALRADGISAWATMDAGPHVKALCRTQDADQVESRLQAMPEVLEVIRCGPGPGLKVET
jgi:diphosphomevalonate decarboxylase